MKEITINGVSYLPASALAKQFRYTTDYIGQLCRARKVDAQLIGRSWYVNPLSLTAHKTGRYTKPSVTVKETEGAEETEVTITRLDVEPVIAKKTARVTATPTQNFAKRIEWQPLKYESDEGDLLPKMKREISPRRVSVDLADSTDITIKTAAKLTTMVADDLPTISLRGKVTVSSIEESFDLEDDIPAEVPVPEQVIEAPVVEKRVQKEFVHHSLPSKAMVLQQKVQKRPVAPVMAAPVASPFTPSTILEVDGEGDVVGIIRITLATTSGVLALLLVLIFFAESTLSADALSYQWGMHFSAESLTALVSLFSN